jgi:hypothetical protein
MSQAFSSCASSLYTRYRRHASYASNRSRPNTCAKEVSRAVLGPCSSSLARRQIVRMRKGLDLLQHLMQRFQCGDHSLWVLLRVVEPRCFLETFVPKFMPKDGNPNEFTANDCSLLTCESQCKETRVRVYYLLDDYRTMLFHSLRDRKRRILP